MKKVIFVVLLMIILLSSTKVYAVPGCCSWHGGEAGCSGGRTLCSDGTVSSCPCDGTSSYSNYGSSSNYSNSNNESENSLLYYIMAIIVGGGIVLFFGSLASAFESGSEKRKEASYERYRLKQKEEKEKIELGKDSVLNHISINCDYMIEDYVKNIDGLILNEINSDDLIKLLESNNINILTLFDSVYENESGHKKDHIAILNRFSETILNYKKLNQFKYKCLKYLIKNNYISNYEQLFLLSLKNKHVEIIKYILNNCNNHNFRFNNNEIFKYLLEIDDLQLVEKISKKKNFDINVSFSMLYYSKNIKISNEYKMLKILSKKDTYSSLNIEEFIDKRIDLKDPNSVLTFVKEYSNINDFIEENGYYIIFLLIKDQNYDCIKTILDKYKNINLNQRIKFDKKNYIGITPLIYACYRKSNKIVKLLLDYGVDINYGDIDGYTALEYACAIENLNIVKSLYECGAKLKADEGNDYIEKALLKKRNYLLSCASNEYIPILYKLKFNKNK